MSEDGARRRAEGERVERDPGTLVDLYLDGLRSYGPREARRARRDDGSWSSLTHDEVGRRVRELALGLRSLGYERGDRVALISDTRLEWALADFALIMSGLVSVPVYPSLPADQMRYILGDAGVRAAFVEDDEQFGKLARVHEDLPGLERAVAFEEVDGPSGAPEALSLDELRALGREAEGELGGSFESHGRKAEPDDLVTLIYTSGTTGAPKGVMLSHDNFYSNVEMTSRVVPTGEQDVALSWLPLSHVFERMSGHYLMWARGTTVAYAGSVDTVGRDMGEVRPTFMTAVPRLYEKVLERSESKARQGGPLKERIFRWARRVGEARAEHVLEGTNPGPWLTLRYAVADLLVFRKLRERTGGRIRYFVSGGAPLPPHVAKFFWAAGLPVLEGYGLTESSPVIAVNPPERAKLGTVGPPIAETEVRIEDDGEILARGPQVMMGYYGNEEATAETLTEDGWLRTGDIGQIDADGYLAITDRKKELIVTSVGKNIAPSPVENAVQRSRYVEHAVLVGDQRKFPIVVVQPAFGELVEWAAERGKGADDRGSLLRDGDVRDLLQVEVDERVADFAHHERPGRILLVPDEFGVESGELTPTMKVKRRVVTDHYADDIDRVYREAEEEGESFDHLVDVAEGR